MCLKKFCHKIVHCGIWGCCIVGFLQQVYIPLTASSVTWSPCRYTHLYSPLSRDCTECIIRSPVAGIRSRSRLTRLPWKVMTSRLSMTFAMATCVQLSPSLGFCNHIKWKGRWSREQLSVTQSPVVASILPMGCRLEAGTAAQNMIYKRLSHYWSFVRGIHRWRGNTLLIKTDPWAWNYGSMQNFRESHWSNHVLDWNKHRYQFWPSIS